MTRTILIAAICSMLAGCATTLPQPCRPAYIPRDLYSMTPNTAWRTMGEAEAARCSHLEVSERLR